MEKGEREREREREREAFFQNGIQICHFDMGRYDNIGLVYKYKNKSYNLKKQSVFSCLVRIYILLLKCREE